MIKAKSPVSKRVCIVCGKEFVVYDRHHRKYCSTSCRNKSTSLKFNMPKWRENVPCPTVGAVGELIVSADLMKHGFHVFRALSPACSCDLIIMKNGICLKIEVTTGTRYENGTLRHSKKFAPVLWDILAIVLEEEIIYEPQLP